MQNPDASNEIFRIAAELTKYTSKNIFLTGKAGTGKTTFLRYIRQNTRKNLAVVAPTGVAAINAGGVTMHSFFQLPFEPFIPVKKAFSGNMHIVDKHNIFSKIQLNSQKRDVMEELELLIIDEVSMMRCDKLDTIDTILRGIRKKNIPFGGVQVLFIGDMYQLPPVAPDADWNILKDYYMSPFFFDAHVIKEIDLVYVELKKMYRQKQQSFIDLLNNVRNNTVTEFDFELLHSRYRPIYELENTEKAITITTHNYKADKINNYELNKLPGAEFVFKGNIEGDFSDKSLPTEVNLTLKVGAQIMFIKNDTGEDRAFYNGKLATVKAITNEKITVTMQDDGSEFELKKQTWENIRYNFNKEKNEIEEEELGKFTQYPIRLAWAITIHKSQGLTFENVIIDAGQSFTPGQVYVALSRCTTLEGMTLLSKINPYVIATDERIVAFAKQEAEVERLSAILSDEKKHYQDKLLINAFNYGRVLKYQEEFYAFVQNKKLPDIKGAIILAKSMLQKSREQYVVAEKFKEQIQNILNKEPLDTKLLEERVTKGLTWFAENFSRDLLQPLADHIVSLYGASKVRKYNKYVRELLSGLEHHLKTLCAVSYGDIVFLKEENAYLEYLPVLPDPPAKPKKEKKSSEPKQIEPPTETYQHKSVTLLKEGKTVEEIALIRNIEASTIIGHLGTFMLEGEIKLTDILPQERIDSILSIIKNEDNNFDLVIDASTNDYQNIQAIWDILGKDYSYNEIKFVYKDWKMQQVQNLSR